MTQILYTILYTNTEYILKNYGIMYVNHILLCTYIRKYAGVDCDVLDSIENGYVVYTDGTLYQSEATYNCHNGYQLSMSAYQMRTCQSNGMWNGTAPSCNSEFITLL